MTIRSAPPREPDEVAKEYVGRVHAMVQQVVAIKDPMILHRSGSLRHLVELTLPADWYIFALGEQNKIVARRAPGALCSDAEAAMFGLAQTTCSSVVARLPIAERTFIARKMEPVDLPDGYQPRFELRVDMLTRCWGLVISAKWSRIGVCRIASLGGVLTGDVKEAAAA